MKFFWVSVLAILVLLILPQVLVRAAELQPSAMSGPQTSDTSKPQTSQPDTNTSAPAQPPVSNREIRFYVDDYADCVIMVSWENIEQSATISIRDADDNVRPASAFRPLFEDGRATLNLGKVESGYWTVIVSGRNLGLINVTGGNKSGEAGNSIIKDFSANIESNYISFSWDLDTDYEEPNVTISAFQNEYTYQTLWADWTKGKKGSVTVPLSDLRTGYYRFQIRVYADYSDEVYETEEPIFIKSSGVAKKLENIKVYNIDGIVGASWDATETNEYYVMLYNYDTLELISADYVYNPFYTFEIPDGCTRIKFATANNMGSGGDTCGDFELYDVFAAEPEGTIVFPEKSIVSESSIPLKINCAENIVGGVYVDSQLILEDVAAGDYNLFLSEGQHEVVAYLKDGAGGIKTFPKQLSVDKTPPTILLKKFNDKTNFSNVILEGSTEANAVVSINGVEQPLNTGRFSAKLELETGSNPFTIAAYDEAGNKSVQTVVIEYQNSVDNTWILYVAVGAPIVIFLTGWYIMLNRRKLSNRETKQGGEETK